MKKLVKLLLVAVLSLTCVLSAVNCGENPNAIVVSASPTPHAEILEQCKPLLKEKGYDLEIRKVSDYNVPNIALKDGSVDANYFQHTPFLNSFNAKNDDSLVAVCKVHYEPFAIYGKDVSAGDFSSKKTGWTIKIPNDGSNLTRALFLLAQEGFITLPEGADPNVNLTLSDIVSDNGNEITSMEARLVSSSLQKGQLGIINGNYALSANISIDSALAVESADGDAASLYANILVVKKGNENLPKILALKEVLLSETIKNFINSTYGGAVLSVV